MHSTHSLTPPTTGSGRTSNTVNSFTFNPLSVSWTPYLSDPDMAKNSDLFQLPLSSLYPMEKTETQNSPRSGGPFNLEGHTGQIITQSPSGCSGASCPNPHMCVDSGGFQRTIVFSTFGLCETLYPSPTRKVKKTPCVCVCTHTHTQYIYIPSLSVMT